MIYTRRMHEAVHKIPVPRGFVMDIIEFSDGEPFLMLRFYADQWYSFDETQRADCAEYLQRVKDTLTMYGVRATLDPVVGSPR